MRPILYYIVVAVGLAVIAMFFISEHSKHLKMGYELTQLRRERDRLRQEARTFDFEISRKTSHEALVEAAHKLRLSLQAPVAGPPR